MRDEGVIHVAGHPLLNRRCTRLPECIRLRNDLYCVEWGVKLYSLTKRFLNEFNEGASTTKLGRLFQVLVTLKVKLNLRRSYLGQWFLV